MNNVEHKSSKRIVKSVPEELHKVKSDKSEEVKGGSPCIFKAAELKNRHTFSTLSLFICILRSTVLLMQSP